MKAFKAVDNRLSHWRSNDGGAQGVWIMEQFQIKNNNNKSMVKVLILELSVLCLHLVHKPSTGISPVFT